MANDRAEFDAEPDLYRCSESRAISAEIGAGLRQAIGPEAEIPQIVVLLERLRAAERMPGHSD